MVSACFKIGEKKQDFLLVVPSYYATTWGSSRSINMNFGMGYNSFLDTVSSSEQQVVLGDFNTGVSCKVYCDGQWDGMRRPYGFEKLTTFLQP